MSGKYTIGAGTGYDYSTVTAAASALTSSGVNGPVEFAIADGTYSGQVTLGSITGASATNTITFFCASNDSSKVVITHSSSYTLYMSAAKFIHFKDVTITTSYSSGYCVYAPNASDCSWESCQIFTTYFGMYLYYADRMDVDKCLIRGGTYGIYLYGSSTDFGEFNRVKNTNFWNTGN